MQRRASEIRNGESSERSPSPGITYNFDSAAPGAEQEADTIGDILDRRVKLSKELEFAESQLKSHREEIKANARALRSAADAIDKKLIPALEALEKRADAAIPARDASFAEGEAEAIEEPSRLRARRPWRNRSSSSE